MGGMNRDRHYNMNEGGEDEYIGLSQYNKDFSQRSWEAVRAKQFYLPSLSKCLY